MTIESPSPWKSESQRYEYPLSPSDVVIDAGGYHGEFAIGIAQRYGCKVISYEPLSVNEFRTATAGYPTIELRPVALGAFQREARIVPLENGSSFLKTSDNAVTVKIVGLKDAFEHPVALLKLNVEGMEYEILDELIGSGLIRHVRFLQVQFHGAEGVCQKRLELLIESIRKTHDLVWGDAPYLWLSFERRAGLKSNSQAGQDIFAWKCGPLIGTFVDIGSAHGVKWSNSYALEVLGWSGILCDASEEARQSAITLRRSTFVLGDASKVDWNSLLNKDWYDYLSLDVDAATLDTLKALPLNRVRFGAITIEHDAYRFGDGPRAGMRQILSSLGYVIIASDVSNDGFPFEDWWVDPSIASKAENFKAAGKSWQEVVAWAR